MAGTESQILNVFPTMRPQIALNPRCQHFSVKFTSVVAYTVQQPLLEAHFGVSDRHL